MKTESKQGLQIGTKSFLTAISVIFILMVAAYVLTLTVPGGTYTWIEDDGGNMIVDTQTEFAYTDGGLPFWKWALSPFLVLGADGNATLLAVIAFLFVIGGVFNSLDQSGLMSYMLQKTVARFGGVRYRLMPIVLLFFMAMGSMIGSFEECVPLVPIVVALSIKLGWDALTGIGMSLLAVGCGFAAGVFNPFTVGVAQEIAGLPMFSGAWFRVVAFVLVYLLLWLFVYRHAKKVERPVEQNANDTFSADKRMDRALICFVGLLGVGIATVFCSAFVTALQDYTMIIVAVTFLVAGVVSVLVAGMKPTALLKSAWSGLTGIFPAVLMILMASSIKYTLEEARVLDTILHAAVELANTLPTWSVILFVYLIVLAMNFFISSGSAKAFMLMPLIVPLAQMFGISSQLCVMAFAFGDGFSNVLYPTNPVLLISLGLVDVSYGKWLKWSWKFQLANLLLTSGLLLAGMAIGY